MTDVDHDMTMRAAARPASSTQLLWLFSRSVLVAAVFASALYAAIYVARDMRSGSAAPPAPANIDVQPGLELLTRASNLDELARLIGFTPVLPGTLPAGTSSTPQLDATQPDSNDARIAEIRFSAQRDAPGPSMLILEWRATSADIDVAPRVVAAGTAVGAIVCGKLAIEARLFFPAATPDASAIAGTQQLVDALAAACR